MRVLVAGATGLVGTALVRFMDAMGHDVSRLVRGERTGDLDIPWDPARGNVPASLLEGFDAVVCLSGAPIAGGRWSPQRKMILRDSRIGPLELLSSTLARCKDKPECLVCASAVGFYGADRGAEVLTEDSPSGADFLAHLCLDWEQAAKPASEAGIRVVNIRFGVVLSLEGGVLRQLSRPFWLGLGGKFGNGRQYMSWLSLDDAVGIIDYSIQTESVEGPLNATAPNPVTNAEFTRAVGHALHRPALARVPAFVLRSAMGEMSQLLLGSTRAYPRRLEAAGYQFRHPEIHALLRALLTTCV